MPDGGSVPREVVITPQREGATMRALRTVAIASLSVVTLALAAASDSAPAQEKFPTKPIRLVIPNAPGGFPDTPARMVAQKMSEWWKQPVVVDNRVGAVGTLAAAQVAKATPDGHTLLWASVTFVSSAALQPALPYDPLKDFADISRTGFGIIAHHFPRRARGFRDSRPGIPVRTTAPARAAGTRATSRGCPLPVRSSSTFPRRSRSSCGCRRGP
ncbi:MAG: hypothetical protein IT529_08320 [Burkholderiales bacterium]|nr:hypothetical protein [Burkholderiales bacterium]